MLIRILQAPQMRKKSLSQSSSSRSRRPSDKESTSLPNCSSVPPAASAIHPGAFQRSASLSCGSGTKPPGHQNERRLSLNASPSSLSRISSAAHCSSGGVMTGQGLAHPGPPAKQIRLDPTFLISALGGPPTPATSSDFAHPLDSSHLIPDSPSSNSSHRSSRIKKLTPKGVEYLQAITHKNPEVHFRVPYPEYGNNGVDATATSPNHSASSSSTKIGATSSGPSPSALPPPSATLCVNNDNGNATSELPSVGAPSLLKTVPSSFNCVNLTSAGPTHD